MDDDINNLLDRYLSGDCTEEEKELVNGWLEKSGRKRNGWSEMQELDREQWLDSLYADIGSSISSAKKEVVVIRKRFLRVWSAAATIAAIILCCLVYDAFRQPVAYSEVRVSLARRSKILLEDGTLVWLNSGSSLKYPERFNGGTREVYLNGEGFFEVAHNPDKPFIIHTGKVKTKVLGTVFNIKAYQEDGKVQVALLSGKVEMQENGRRNGAGNSIILNPNQLGFYDKGQQKLLKPVSADVHEFAAWRTGQLIFDETPLSEVLKTLSRSHNTSFSIEGEKLSQCKITGTFDTKESIEHIVQTICVSIDADFYRNKKNITLKGRGCLSLENQG